MHVLITPDVPDWAIGRLTKQIVDNNPRFNFHIVNVHPRGVANGFFEVKKLVEEGLRIDFWHGQYWNSAIQLLELMPELGKIPSLLTHHNHHSLEEKDWSSFTLLNEMTSWGVDKLREKHPNVVKIPHGVDLDKHRFIKEYPPKEPAVGYVGRIVPWKHLKEICETSNKLGYKVIACGYVDKPNYYETVPKSNLMLHGGYGRGAKMTDSFVIGLYRKMSVFVMYSSGEKESGTLPLLEAMARGVPVMATAQGMARDIIEDGKNGIIFDENNFEEKLKMVMEDEKLRETLRQNAWQTIKNYSIERFARNYAKAYYRAAFGHKPVISAIIPTFNRGESLIDTILSVDSQDYDAKEIIVVDDGSTDKTKDIVAELKKKIKTPLLYLNTKSTSEYGLAKARNMGVVESLGSILLFLDDRLKLNEGSLKEIAKANQGTWYHGAKIASGKKSNKITFVENFSWIHKKDFVRGGMFCERMNIYGGLSQITREQYNGKVGFAYNDKASITQMMKSGGKSNKEIWKAKDIINKLYD